LEVPRTRLPEERVPFDLAADPLERTSVQALRVPARGGVLLALARLTDANGAVPES
jgi:hypothetical protein